MFLSDLPSVLLSIVVKDWISYQDLIYIASSLSKSCSDSNCKRVYMYSFEKYLQTRDFVNKDESNWIYKFIGYRAKYESVCKETISDTSAHKLTFSTDSKLNIKAVNLFASCSVLETLSITCGGIESNQTIKKLVEEKRHCSITIYESFRIYMDYNAQTKSLVVEEKAYPALKALLMLAWN